MNISAVNATGAGLNLFLAVVLLLAAILKARDIQSVELLLVNTLPRRLWRIRGIDSRIVGRVAAGIEAVGGVALLVAPRPVYPVVIGVLVLPLVVILTIAVRAATRKVACGCFGGSRRTAGPYEVGRAAVITATGLGLCILTWLVSGADPTVGSLTGWSWRVAIPLIAAAVAPTVWSRLTRRAAPATEPAQSAGVARSRREVLHGIGLTTAMIGAAAIIPTNALTAHAAECATPLKGGPPRCVSPCQAAYDRCVGANPGMKQCCIDCYVRCQGGGGLECVPGLACAGAWPDPRRF